MMESKQQIWLQWARTLHRWGGSGFVAWLLEATGPVRYVLAQLVYVGQPFMEVLIPSSHLKALATMLEEPGEAQAFVKLLREAGIS